MYCICIILNYISIVFVLYIVLYCVLFEYLPTCNSGDFDLSICGASTIRGGDRGAS